MRKLASVVLVLLLAAPPVDLRSAPVLGSLDATVTLAGRPLSGATLALLDLSTGSIVRGSSAANGTLSVTLPPGTYAVTAESAAGLVVARGPAVVSVLPGQVLSAAFDLAAVAGALLAQDAVPSPPLSSTVIRHEPVGCLIAGQFPLLPATIEPSSSVARARVYFRAASGESWFYVEMTPAADGGNFAGKLPRPKLEASPVQYYIQATTTEFGDSQTPEISTVVVDEPTECPEDKKIAAIGPPGEVTVFSAATGAAIAPVGFAAGGLALTAGTLALLAGGAAAAGIGAAVTVFNPAPTPAPSAQPTAPPSAAPTPRPSPSPSPSPEPTPPPVTPFR